MATAPAEPRSLEFHSFHEVLDEIDNLQRNGCEQLGAWNLAQACNHLDYFMASALDGATFRVPWLIRVLFAKRARQQIFSTGRMKAGIPTPQKPLPDPTLDEKVEVAKYRSTIQRMMAHQGEFHDSPFFGHLTPDEVRRLNLIHAAHHLRFLQPRTPAKT